MALVSALPLGFDRTMHGTVQLANLEGGISPRHSPLAHVFGRQEEFPAQVLYFAVYYPGLFESFHGGIHDKAFLGIPPKAGIPAKGE